MAPEEPWLIWDLERNLPVRKGMSFDEASYLAARWNQGGYANKGVEARYIVISEDDSRSIVH